MAVNHNNGGLRAACRQVNDRDMTLLPILDVVEMVATETILLFFAGKDEVFEDGIEQVEGFEQSEFDGFGVYTVLS